MWGGVMIYYLTRDQAKIYCEHTAEPGLAAQVASHFTLGRDRRDGKGAKSSLNVTVVSGRTQQEDPRSLIVFFRTHFGSFGDLVSELVENRDPSKRSLVVQSDLASTNNLRIDPTKIDLVQAGCISHARRRFSKAEDEAPDHCASMLQMFHNLSTYEQGLDAVGRQADNVNAVRQGTCRQVWGELLEDAKIMEKLWSRDTGPGEAARYVINNFEKLTYYLDDHRLTTNNDFSERMLRMEKLIKANALFRQTLDGRAALDIIRSILQTSVAAKVNCQDYLVWLLRQDEQEVASNPSEFTPQGYARQK